MVATEAADKEYMSGTRAKVFAIVAALSMSLMVTDCVLLYTSPSPAVSLGNGNEVAQETPRETPETQMATRELPAADRETPLAPIPSDLPIAPVAVAKSASPALLDTGRSPEMVRLAQAIQAEPLPTPAGTPAKVEQPAIPIETTAKAERLPAPPAPAGTTSKPGDGPQLPDQSAQIPANGPPLLHVEDLDVRKVFEMISRQGKVNILISPNVTGKVTLDLRGSSVEEGTRGDRQTLPSAGPAGERPDLRLHQGRVGPGRRSAGPRLPFELREGLRPAKNDQAIAHQARHDYRLARQRGRAEERCDHG